MSKPMYDSLLCPALKVTEEQLETDRQLFAFDRAIQHLTRRSFLSVLTSAAAAGAVGVAGTGSAKAQAASVPITAVLNFALNLEYLEANFYSLAATGSPIPQSISLPGSGALTGVAPITLDANTKALAAALAKDEINHILTLQSTISSLGGTPIPQPAINLAAKGTVTNQIQFLAAARQFTALGGSAYAGSAALLVSNATVLTAAARILGAEGQHAGALNFQCVAQGVMSPAIDAQDVPPTSTQIFTVLPNTALGPQRNTSQVLGVAYGVSMPTTTNPMTGITMGGFFPNGVNGTVTST